MGRLFSARFAAAALAGCLASGNASAQVEAIATPPAGSVWNTMASVIAAEARKADGGRLVVQPYGGNGQMMQAVNDALAEYSLNDINDVITAVSGTGEYSAPMPNLRVVARINPFPVGLFVRADSGMTRVSDLKGMRVPSGWEAFPLNRPLVGALLEADGISYDEVIGVPMPELIRGADALVSGQTDAAFFAVGGPKVAEVSASVGGVRFLEVASDEAALAAVRRHRPTYYFSEVTPAPVRVGIEKPIMMLTWDNVLVVGAHVPDEQVKALLAAIFDNRDAIMAAYPPLAALNVETAYVDYPGVEYHPGAEAFFAERGVARTPTN
ncbi:TAXI family TRAP transporter solute-binding subunit [Neotabrizicola sp. VNH66]|uniref:TAXI family TRAP transporter solute-binding subunit n=1 Tax=Neotabrizicola sp. VNH66 TaxID=3400918 RepID=UPI003C0098BA